MPSFVSRGSLLHGKLFAAAIFTGMSACSSVTSPESSLAVARQQWADHGPASHSYAIYRTCECLPEMTGPVVVTVRDGAIESRTYATTGAPVASNYFRFFPSIDGLFGVIDEALSRDATLEVSYHPTFGYPIEVAIDLEDLAVDGGARYSVTDLRSR